MDQNERITAKRCFPRVRWTLLERRILLPYLMLASSQFSDASGCHQKQSNVDRTYTGKSVHGKKQNWRFGCRSNASEQKYSKRDDDAEMAKRSIWKCTLSFLNWIVFDILEQNNSIGEIMKYGFNSSEMKLGNSGFGAWSLNLIQNVFTILISTLKSIFR